MSNPFEVVMASSVTDALEAKGQVSRWFAGGTDLIPEIKNDLVSPSRLVNLKRIEELGGIQESEQGMRIGALATLAEIATHKTIRARYHALAQACELAASPQIRNVATIGGNLCQDSRCAYYRNGFDCLLRGGDICYMREGENREAAVIGYHDCVHVHPSDPANVLVAFDAQIVVRGRAGEQIVAAQDFFHAPDAADLRMNVLNADEIVTAIVLPNVSEHSHSVYVKAMDRAAWAFALASACVRVEWNGSKIETARVVLGGVAPTPWREFRVETTLSGSNWDQATVTQVEWNVLDEAQPLAHNGYKLRLARALLKRALTECWQGSAKTE